MISTQVDRNVISASANALVDGFEFGIVEYADSCMLCEVDYDAPADAESFSKYYTPPGRPATSLANNHQSHYVAIDAEHKQCSDGLRRGARADYDELVCQSTAQLLPAYKLFVRRVG